MLKRNTSLRGILACLALSMLESEAGAVDGVQEINQTCAVQTGCFAGDPAGFPVVISAPGTSVRLTGSLTVPDENTGAIVVIADDVTVDLNGFAILGPTVCTGSPVTSCAPTGTGIGINAAGTDSVSVSKGTVRGMGATGINASGRVRIQGVEVVDSGSNGIRTTHASGSLVTDCVVIGNGNTGIVADGGVIRDSVVNENATYGIDSYGSTVIGNTMLLNGSYGLRTGGATGYGSNQISSNNGGNTNLQVGGSSFEIAPNVCGGDLVCP